MTIDNAAVTNKPALVDAGDREPQLTQTDGRVVAARTTTDDDRIKRISHESNLA